MLKGKFKAIISDVDGTLTPIVPNTLPTDKIRQSIRRATDNGITFSLASGRPFFLVKYLIDHLGNVGPCIVDNGAVIANSKDGSVIWEATLPVDHANRILELSSAFKLVRASCDIGAIENPKNISSSTKVRKISIHDIPIEQAEEILNKVSLEFKDVTGVKASSYEGNHLVDVYFSNINATKQHAVFKLAEILGISHEEIIGIGDGYNDFPLLMACGLKVAMGNAVDELKAIADYIAPSVEDDGLAQVIEKYLTNFLEGRKKVVCVEKISEATGRAFR